MDIEIGKTYVGNYDFVKGYSSHRTVIGVVGDTILIKNEVGDNPPVCYISRFNMTKENFISWLNEIT